MTQQTNPSDSIRIHLRPVSENDLPILFQQQREPEANNMAAFPSRDCDAFMAHWAKILGDRTSVAMAVLVDNSVAGHVGCWTLDGQRFVGYWIGKEYWGKGIATKMLSTFLRYVTVRPLYAHVAKHNFASIRVLEKCGFIYDAKTTTSLGEAEDGIEELLYSFNTPSINDLHGPPPNI
jgi:RimJ/RimL family protein N-acetyltransferase